MLRDIELWKRVSRDAALLERASQVDAGNVASVAALRRGSDEQEVSVALELSAARAKAIHQLGEVGYTLIADTAGVEQASGSAVATHKAKRIKLALGGQLCADLCCGIGGDSMAMAQAGLSVVAVDRDPLRAWMASCNTGGRVSAVCADVSDLALEGVALHIDPARRDEGTGRRAWKLDDYQPGPAVIGRLIEQAPAAVVKLSPGVDLQALPWPGEVEFISDHGRLVQAVLWCGAFAGDARRATRIDAQGNHELRGQPGDAPMDEAGRYLFAVDASVERAGLIGVLSQRIDAPSIHPRLGLLTSDKVIDSPWLTGFELIEQLPWRPKRVRQWLGANDGGLVEVKTRDKACNPDVEQQQLRGQGSTTYTVFVLRFDTKVHALITRRL